MRVPTSLRRHSFNFRRLSKTMMDSSAAASAFVVDAMAFLKFVIAFIVVLFVSPTSPLTPSRPSRHNIPAPPNLDYFDFQKDAICALVERPNGVLLCDEMGLGKTISAIGALNCLDFTRVLIIAPKSLLTNWETELQRWLVVAQNGGTDVKMSIVTATSGIPHDDSNVILMNYDIVKKYRVEIDKMGVWDILLCDEAHYLKNAEAARTIAILGDTVRNIGEKGIRARRKWFLTGSPVLNNPHELYPLLRALDPRGKVIPELLDREDFLNRYCGRRDSQWGVVYKGGKNLSELRERLRSGDAPILMRRTKNKVLGDLPAKRHQMIPLEDNVVVAQEGETLLEALEMTRLKYGSSSVNHSGDLSSLKVSELKTRLKARGLSPYGRKADLVDRLRQNAVAKTRARVMETREDDSQPKNEASAEVFDSIGSALRSETRKGGRWEGLERILGLSDIPFGRDDDDSSAILGALSEARHATALEKVPHAIELIENAIDSHKVVAFAHHRDVQDALMTAFQGHAVALNGRSTQEERAEVVEQFQNDDSIRLFIGSIRAAGVGITLTAASHVIFVEFDWSPMIVQQAEDRCHRVGQLSSVLVQYLFFRGTIDEHLASLLSSKQSTVSVAVDSPTGAATWVFDFGKHRGETVADVAAGSSGYLRWIVDEKVYSKRPKLAEALCELGYITEAEASSAKEAPNVPLANGAVSRSHTKVNDDKKEDGYKSSNYKGFVISFGKHKGELLSDIPREYRRWLISSGATRNQSGLRAAMKAMEEDD